MRPYLLDAVADLGYAVFESGLYNLNIIGIRSKNHEANSFDFFPTTYNLPGDYSLFVEEFKRCG
mgnify:CR=1 FL=1